MRRFWKIYGACQATAGAITSTSIIISLFVYQKVPQLNVAELIYSQLILLIITVLLAGSGIYIFKNPE